MNNLKPEEREAIHNELKEKFEYTQDLDNFKPLKHRWVDRGEILSCEGGDHPYHQAYKRKNR